MRSIVDDVRGFAPNTPPKGEPFGNPYYLYKIPLLPSPLLLKERRGIILQTEHGLGEAAPLPLFSKETLLEALLSLAQGTPSPAMEFAL